MSHVRDVVLKEERYEATIFRERTIINFTTCLFKGPLIVLLDNKPIQGTPNCFYSR